MQHAAYIRPLVAFFSTFASYYSENGMIFRLVFHIQQMKKEPGYEQLADIFHASNRVGSEFCGENTKVFGYRTRWALRDVLSFYHNHR